TLLETLRRLRWSERIFRRRRLSPHPASALLVAPSTFRRERRSSHAARRTGPLHGDEAFDPGDRPGERRGARGLGMDPVLLPSDRALRELRPVLLHVRDDGSERPEREAHR